MSQERNFQKIWEFRRRDDDNDSSDDSKTCSGVEPELEKNNLVSALILAGNDEVSDTPENEQNDQLVGGDIVRRQVGKGSAKKVGSRRKRSDGIGKGSTKKVVSKRKEIVIETKATKRAKKGSNTNKKENGSTIGPGSVEDLKIFTKSILQDFKVERENMFARMQEEMRQLVDIKVIPKTSKVKNGLSVPKSGEARRQKRIKVDIKDQNCNGKPLERSIISSKKSQKCAAKVTEEQVNHDLAAQTIRANGKEKVQAMTTLSAKKSTHSLPDQIVSSSYLTLPSVVPDKQVEQQLVESSPMNNCTKAGVARNGTCSTLERENLVFDGINHHAYYPGIQAEESFVALPQMGSRNMNCYDQFPNISTTSVFPVPLQQRFDNTFNSSHQIVLENPSVRSNLFSARMNGGAIRFCANGRAAFSGNFAANNFQGRVSNRPDGQLAGFGNQDVKDAAAHFY